MAVWVERFSSFTASSASSWLDYDIFTNQNVPKGSVAAIFCSNTGTTSAIMGVRKDASSLNRYIEIAPRGQANGVIGAFFYVQVDSGTGLIEIYTSTTTNTSFILLGYWTGVTFTEAFSSFSGNGSSTWTDISDGSVPNGSVCSYIVGTKGGTAYIGGIRSGGSTLNRYLTFSPGGLSYPNSIKPLTMNAMKNTVVQHYSNFGTVLFFFTGYFGPEDLGYVDGFNTLAYSTTGWQTGALSSYIGARPMVVDMVTANTRNAANVYYYGARTPGSSLSRYFYNDRATSTSTMAYYLWPTKANNSGNVEIYIENSSYEYILYTGYYYDKLLGVSETCAVTDTVRALKNLKLTDATALSDYISTSKMKFHSLQDRVDLSYKEV